MSLRFLLASLLVLTAAVGGYVFLGPMLADPEGQAEAERLAALEAEIRDGLVSRVEALEQPELLTTVAGNEVSRKTWDFRGTTQLTEETMGSVYGRMMLHCDRDFARPACWTVTFLKVDGRPVVELDEEQIAAASEQAQVALASADGALKTAPTQAMQTIETPGAPEATDAPAASAAPAATAAAAIRVAPATPEQAAPATPAAAEPEAAAEAPSVEPPAAAPVDATRIEGELETGATAPAAESAEAIDEAESGPVATHQISASEVNARREPNRDADIVAILPIGQDLVRIGGDDQWGQYKILGGEFDGVDVWVYAPLVSPKR